MNSEAIESSLYSSIDHLFRNDLFLLTYDVHERTIAHRLAVYLEHRFTGFHVDCEYNNDLDSETGRKQVYFPCENAISPVIPDIVVHHRGRNGPGHNLLVLELKKLPGTPSELDRDREKLCRFTASDQVSHLSYRCGAFVTLGVKEAAGEFRIEWFEHGVSVEDPAEEG